MSEQPPTRVEDEVVGLLLSAWMGDEQATVTQVKRLQEALKLAEQSPDRAVRRIFEVAKRCYDLALTPEAAGDGADDAHLALAAAKMGAPYLRRALRSLSGAESSVRFGNDLGNELLVAFAELAGRGRSSAKERGLPSVGLGELTTVAVAASAPVAEAPAPVAPEPVFDPPTKAAAGSTVTAAPAKSPGAQAGGVPVDGGSEERDGEAELKLSRGWREIQLRVQKRGQFLPSFQFARSRGFAVRGRDVMIYAKSPAVADTLKNWKEREILAEEIRHELGRAVDVRFTFDPQGTAPKMAAPPEPR